MVSTNGALFELKKTVLGMFFEQLHCVASYIGRPGMKAVSTNNSYGTRRLAQAKYQSRSAFALLRVPPFPRTCFLQQTLGCEMPARCHTPMSPGHVPFCVGETSLLQPGRDVHGCTALGGRREQGVSAGTLLCCCIAVTSTEDFPLHSYSSPDTSSHQGHGAA